MQSSTELPARRAYETMDRFWLDDLHTLALALRQRLS